MKSSEVFSEGGKNEKRYLAVMEDKPVLHPLRSLLYSRKFMVAILDIVVSLLTHYIGGSEMDYLILTMQPLVLMVIGAIAAEDVAKIKNGG